MHKGVHLCSRTLPSQQALRGSGDRKPLGQRSQSLGNVRSDKIQYCNLGRKSALARKGRCKVSEASERLPSAIFSLGPLHVHKCKESHIWARVVCTGGYGVLVTLNVANQRVLYSEFHGLSLGQIIVWSAPYRYSISKMTPHPHRSSRDL